MYAACYTNEVGIDILEKAEDISRGTRSNKKGKRIDLQDVTVKKTGISGKNLGV